MRRQVAVVPASAKRDGPRDKVRKRGQFSSSPRRLLIDKRCQRRGIGREVLAQLVDVVRAEGATELLASYEPGKGDPWPFYRQFGFQRTGKIDDGEIVIRLPLSAC